MTHKHKDIETCPDCSPHVAAGQAMAQELRDVLKKHNVAGAFSIVMPAGVAFSGVHLPDWTVYEPDNEGHFCLRKDFDKSNAGATASGLMMLSRMMYETTEMFKEMAHELSHEILEPLAQALVNAVRPEGVEAPKRPMSAVPSRTDN